MDPKTVRPPRDWCSILMEERKDMVGGIYLPIETGVEKVTEGAGIIVRVGVGELNKTLDLSPGQRVVIRSYLKYANTIPNEEMWPSGAKKEYFLMSSKDIMALVPQDIAIGVFGRPAVSGKIET